MSSKSDKKPTASITKLPLWLYGLLGIVSLALIILAISALSQASPKIALPLEISVSQASDKRTSGAFILDVREPQEWEQVHIPGATLIPLGQLPERLNEIPKDKEVVVVCRSGNRSATGRDILLKGGFSSVTSMAGGMNQWQAAGFATATGK